MTGRMMSFGGLLKDAQKAVIVLVSVATVFNAALSLVSGELISAGLTLAVGWLIIRTLYRRWIQGDEEQ